MQYDLKYSDLYDMTLKELEKTLDCRREGQAYSLWKNATLIGALFEKNFPKNYKEACPELFPLKTSIPMPDFLKKKYSQRRGNNI